MQWKMKNTMQCKMQSTIQCKYKVQCNVKCKAQCKEKYIHNILQNRRVIWVNEEMENSLIYKFIGR